MGHDQTTLQPGSRLADSGPERRAALTVLAHPVPGRVGARCRLPKRGTIDLSRRSPDFDDPRGKRGPLDDPYLSRKPSRLTVDDRGGIRVRLDPNLAGSEIVAAGEVLRSGVVFDEAALRAGVVLELGGRVALLLHAVSLAEREVDDCGLVGMSDAIEAVRRQIRQVADLDVPVLIRGESGVGKELVAQAIHLRSARKGAQFVPVNVAALTPSTATSALFGHRRGAFTGADRHRRGLFREAEGGTLLLDEIGEAAPELQAMLLRALETGQIRPVGEDRPVDVDVRVLAATDAGLEDAVRMGRFKAPLLHRLAGFELMVPPLRERREDIALLLVRFLNDELAMVSETHRLSPTPAGAEPWLSAPLVARLCRADWPGNVRQLRNAARQLVIASRGGDVLTITPAVERVLAGKEPVPEAGVSGAWAFIESMSGTWPNAPGEGGIPVVADPSDEDAADGGGAAGGGARPSEIDDDALAAALKRNDYKTGATARELGISKTSLYALIEASPRIRKARDLTVEEIEVALDEAGTVVEAARDLEVSARGLRLRMTELGLGE